MYSYDSNNFFHFQLHHDTHAFVDYDFDAHIEQCANGFMTDDKGILDDSCQPFQLFDLESDDFGSTISSRSSRSPSIYGQTNPFDDSDAEDSILSQATSIDPIPSGTDDTTASPSPDHDSPSLRQPSPQPSDTASESPPTQSDSIHAPFRPLSPTPLLRRTRRRKLLFTAPANLSDEADDDSDNNTDDEYVPTPRSLASKRRRASPSHRNPRRSVSSTSTSSPTPPRRPSGLSLSRNRQTKTPAKIIKACDSSKTNFICPECGWRQANKRLPDFKRHLRTHTRPDEGDQTKGWWCKGVLLSEAHKYNIPKDAKTYEFLGQQRTGGCMQTFSRRDALKRHLDNANVVCVGRPCEAMED